MKKIFVCLATALLMLTFVPAQSKSEMGNPITSISTDNPVESAEAQALLNRLDKINTMDKTGLNSNEKKELKKEVRVINRELKELGGGVYISVGAAILILLLLIILL